VVTAITRYSDQTRLSPDKTIGQVAPEIGKELGEAAT
jgi:hypothetical protein